MERHFRKVRSEEVEQWKDVLPNMMSDKGAIIHSCAKGLSGGLMNETPCINTLDGRTKVKESHCARKLQRAGDLMMASAAVLEDPTI